ncbi:MAG: arylsulfatase [Gammaproteobacteria bacterium]|nr:arylsulfatase [Gammaproteobacteria bacterium]
MWLAAPALQAAARPNVLLVVADDLGFSDLGSFGGEIDTPNLDRLSQEGLRLTNFHTAATCSPTRAMLMSGVDHHLAGLGNMAEKLTPNQRGKPGYEGYLNERVVSLATRLRDAGYTTFAAGKWHLGKLPEHSPAARGFERSFMLLEGGGNHYNDTGMFPYAPKSHYRDGLEEVSLPQDFYSTRSYTDKMLQYLEAGRDEGQPFFAYLAYTAPHWPLQAPRSVIDKYRGRYDQGYDVLRQQRIQALEAKGLIAEGLVQRMDHIPLYRPWTELSAQERRAASRTMEVYAAMIDEMDRQFGRILEYLERSGELDNTVIIFLSDNGAEGADLSRYRGMADWLPRTFDNSLENLGNASSYAYLGAGWATATMAPFYQMKRSSAEGGIRTPAFVWYPGFERQRRVSGALVTVKDIAPTLLEMAGVSYGGREYRGRTVEPVSGRSLLPLLQGTVEETYSSNDAVAWELFGHRAVRRGDWKLVSLRPPYGDGSWQLFNLAEDLAESNDLSARRPDLVEQMRQDWSRYAEETGVVLPE